jgi:transcriptional regulator with XRE-family HTH domain
MSTLTAATPPTPAAVFLRARGATVRDLAAVVGVSAPYMSQVLNGRRHPSPLLRRAIAAALDVAEHDLFPKE